MGAVDYCAAAACDSLVLRLLEKNVMGTIANGGCDICRKPVQWPSHHGDWNCPHCNQAYAYDEGFGIRLTDAQLELLRNPSRWIPVSEQLPDDGQSVIACFEDGGMTGQVGEATFNKRGGWFSTERGAWGASHWMPLPGPPSLGSK